MDCGSDSITLTWEASLGAFLYFCHGGGPVWDCSHLYLIRNEVQVQWAPLRIHIQCLYNCIQQPLQQLCQWLHHCRNRYNTYKEIQDCRSLDVWSLITNFMPSLSAPCPPGSVEALLDCQRTRRWWAGWELGAWYPSLPPWRTSMVVFSVVVPLPTAAGSLTWSVAKFMTLVSFTMMESVPVCLPMPYKWSLVRKD